MYFLIIKFFPVAFYYTVCSLVKPALSKFEFQGIRTTVSSFQQKKTQNKPIGFSADDLTADVYLDDRT